MSPRRRGAQGNLTRNWSYHASLFGDSRRQIEDEIRYTPAMHLKSALLAVALLPVFAVAQTSQTAAPTVAEAQAFMDKAEADLLALTNEAGRAQWVQETFITDDTEAIAAKANERLLDRRRMSW